MTPFTDAQFFQIEQLLGYSTVWRAVDPTCVDAIVACQANDAAVAFVVATMASIVTIESMIDGFLPAGGTFKTEETETDFNLEVEALRRQGRILIARIARCMGISIREDYFGARQVDRYLGSIRR